MRSNKRLGQYFLHDKLVLKRIATSLEVHAGDTVIEIGSGHGELTDVMRIMNNKLRIVGIEKDRELAELLVKKMEPYKDIEIVCGDVLKLLSSIIHNSQFIIHSYKIVGNIPYYITGHLLRIVGELEPKPAITVLTMQKEVAERICAQPPRMNLLAASVQAWARPEIMNFIPKHHFLPPSKVDSAIVKLTTLPEDKGFRAEFYYPFIRALFKQPRKTIFNNLKTLHIPQEGLLRLLKQHRIDPQSRPQDLDVQTIKNLARNAV